jgi:peptide/nickel transport system ATP-binding protein
VRVPPQVLLFITRLQDEFGTAIILITHDLGVIAETADDVVVMYAGAAMEKAGRREIFFENHHPYTEGLLHSLPAYGGARGRLRPISGQPPSLINLPRGCPFHPRCPYVMERCRVEEPSLMQVVGRPGHTSACWLPLDPTERAVARAALETEPAAAGEIGATP